MYRHDFGLSVSRSTVTYEWYCYGYLVIRYGSVALDICFFSCSSILLNVVYWVQYQHLISTSVILTAVSFQMLNSIINIISMILNSFKALSIICYALCMSWLHFWSLLTNSLIDWRAPKTTGKAKIYWDDFVAVINPCAAVLESLFQVIFSLHLFWYYCCSYFD